MILYYIFYWYDVFPFREVGHIKIYFPILQAVAVAEQNKNISFFANDFNRFLPSAIAPDAW